MLKLQLSTTLLAVAIIAIALGWYVDRNSPESITGFWKRAGVPGMIYSGYSTTLDIRPDGTFTKVQKYRTCEEVVVGNYRFLEERIVEFQVTSISGFAISHDELKHPKLNWIFLCRCAIDRAGMLLIHEYSRDYHFSDEQISEAIATDHVPTSEIGLTWETYMPANAE